MEMNRDGQIGHVHGHVQRIRISMVSCDFSLRTLTSDPKPFGTLVPIMYTNQIPSGEESVDMAQTENDSRRWTSNSWVRMNNMYLIIHQVFLWQKSVKRDTVRILWITVRNEEGISLTVMPWGWDGLWILNIYSEWKWVEVHGQFLVAKIVDTKPFHPAL